MLKKAATLTSRWHLDIFGLLGRAVVRAPWLIVIAWVTLILVLSLAFPALTKVVENQTIQPLPARAMAASEQMTKDFGDTAQNVVVVVMTNPRGLQPADDDVYRRLAATLRTDTGDVSAAIDAGELEAQPVRPLAHILIGAMDAAAMTIANAPDPEASRAEVRRALHAVVDGMLRGRG